MAGLALLHQAMSGPGRANEPVGYLIVYTFDLANPSQPVVVASSRAGLPITQAEPSAAIGWL
jgi:hypothetical protein